MLCMAIIFTLVISSTVIAAVPSQTFLLPDINEAYSTSYFINADYDDCMKKVLAALNFRDDQNQPAPKPVFFIMSSTFTMDISNPTRDVDPANDFPQVTYYSAVGEPTVVYAAGNGDIITGDTLAVAGTPTADNLVVTANGSNNWNIGVGSNASGAIGNFTIKFNKNIKKAASSDIGLKAYNGTTELTLTNANTVKNLLFGNFGSGAGDVLTGKVNSTFAQVVSAMKASVTENKDVTKLEFTVYSSDGSENILLTLNII